MSDKLQRTSLDVLREELERRFEDEMETCAQGASDILREMVLDPVDPPDLFLSFFHEVNEERKEKSGSSRRVPSRSEGGGSNLPPTSPPHTSRGVTKRPIETITKFIRIVPPSDETTAKKILGGYDGGFEVGFIGTWLSSKFKPLLDTLEEAKKAARDAAQDRASVPNYLTLGGRDFVIYPTAAPVGVLYKYVIEGSGIKVYIHSNPKGSIQGIRVRYGHEALAGRNLFAVHLDFLEWLQELGFTVTKETVSRVDMQVMSFRPISDFTQPIFSNKAVMRAMQWKTHGKGKKICTSITIGTTIQLCIYDKKQELLETHDAVKMSIIFNDCLCGEIPEELTRVEYRMRRDALKYLGVNTVQDLLERELAIVEFLTHDWFRILRDEKSRGNETKQAIAPAWQEVCELFKEHFPGSDNGRKEIARKIRGRTAIHCTGESLVNQAVGCLSTAVALVKGTFENAVDAMAFVTQVLSEKVDTIISRSCERMYELGIIKGVSSPDVMDWHLDPRYACESSVDDGLPPEFRVVFDEDLQYENFRRLAVAGCPF